MALYRSNLFDFESFAGESLLTYVPQDQFARLDGRASPATRRRLSSSVLNFFRRALKGMESGEKKMFIEGENTFESVFAHQYKRDAIGITYFLISEFPKKFNRIGIPAGMQREKLIQYKITGETGLLVFNNRLPEAKTFLMALVMPPVAS